MVQSPWEANRFAASQEIPRISRNPKVHYRTHKRPPPVPILGQPIQFIYPYPTYWRSILISTHLRLGLTSGQGYIHEWKKILMRLEFVLVVMWPSGVECQMTNIAFLKVRPLCCLEISGNNYPEMRCYIPEERRLQIPLSALKVS